MPECGSECQWPAAGGRAFGPGAGSNGQDLCCRRRWGRL